MTRAALLTESSQLGLAYSFRGLVPYYHGGENGSTQAGARVVGELHPVLQTERQTDRQTLGLPLAFETSKPILPHPHDTLILTRPVTPNPFE